MNMNTEKIKFEEIIEMYRKAKFLDILFSKYDYLKTLFKSSKNHHPSLKIFDEALKAI